MKFYSTSHVNTFLSITNDRGDDCHSEKAYRSKKKQIFHFSSIFFGVVIFFKNVHSFVRTFTLNKIYRHTIPYLRSQE